MNGNVLYWLIGGILGLILAAVGVGAYIADPSSMFGVGTAILAAVVSGTSFGMAISVHQSLKDDTHNTNN